MSKTIIFKENSLIAIKEKLNEIMVGTDGVSHNDIVTLWHGTDIPGIVGILKSGTICAREGVQHGETYGMNWFSLKKVNNFNKGIVFSIEVPSSDFKTKFKMMNSSEAITRDDRLDISQYNLKIEMFCTFGREQLNRYYDLIVEKGEHYPIETIRDEVFYKWCEKSDNEDVYMSTSDYDLGLILSNILGEDKVRAEGFLEENTKLNEVAPEVDEYTIGGETDSPVGGRYYHISDGEINENIEPEVESSEVDLSSFKKKDSLVPSIWKDEDTLNSKVRLKLLDIADDFWEFVNITWVEPKGIILTGSICNFNWSKFSDIDLHLIVDFDEIDDRDDFVRDYMDAKKNEWNNEHKSLKIMDYPVELYVQNINEMPEAGGIYDLEENKWLRKPNKDDIKPIGLNKFSIKDRAATIMTIIDDMWDALNSTDDMYDIRQLGKDASKLWDKVKKMRKNSLSKNGEGGAGNIVYKVMRRMGYLDKIFDLRSAIYDKLNSVTEATKQYKGIILEYLDNDHNLLLYKYFKWATTATDFEKVEDLIYQCSYETKKYIAKMSKQIDEFEPLRLALIKDEDIMYDDEFVENIANIIVNNNLTDAFTYYLQVTGNSYDLPSWLFMDFNRVVKNEWCIHFGADSESIAREGFTGGTEEIEHLAYTGAGQQKHGAGYDFAFPLGERDIDNNEYGDEAVIFQTSGIEVYHSGDSQKQVVFWGPNAKNFIPIKYDSEIGDWCIYGMNNQVLKSGSPSTILNWVLNNLPQYRKQIMAGKNGYIPKYYDYNQRKRVPYPIYRNESVKKYLTVLKEEIVADGNAEHNPFEKRWKAERQALKNFLVNCGKIMTSKENGKQYKVYFDQTISNLIGYNYCICVQWNPIEMKPESTIYIRALDKFTNRIFQAQYDDRGKDNMRGTYDDTGYSQRFEGKAYTKQMLTEANNKKRFKRQTLNVLAQGLGLDPADPQLQSLESDFRNVYFGHLSNQEIDRVIGYEPLFAKCALDLGFPNNGYNDTEFTKYVNYLILNTKDKPNYTEIINLYKSKVNSFDDLKQIVGGEIKAGKEADAEQQANMGSSVNPNYQVLGPLTFEEAQKYGNRSGDGAGTEGGRICYTQYEDTWLSSNYSDDNRNQCFVLLRNDWQSYKWSEHDGSEASNGLGELSQYSAYDDYGLSMIMLFINPNGELHECNVRWNHNAEFAPRRSVDHALTEMDISNLMGIPFAKVFNVETFDDKKNKALARLANGEKAEYIFDNVGDEIGSGRFVQICGRWNILREDGKGYTLPIWFDKFDDITDGLYYVKRKGKVNVINSEGRYIWNYPYEEWFDKIDYPSEGFMVVAIDKNVNYADSRPMIYNYIDLNGNLLSDEWFAECNNMRNGMAKVALWSYGKKVYNYIRKNGEYVFKFKNVNYWFLNVGRFFNGITKASYYYEEQQVENFITNDGKFLIPKGCLRISFIGGSDYKVELLNNEIIYFNLDTKKFTNDNGDNMIWKK